MSKASNPPAPTGPDVVQPPAGDPYWMNRASELILQTWVALERAYGRAEADSFLEHCDHHLLVEPPF